MSSPSLFFNRGNMKAHQNQYAEALADYDMVLSLSSDHKQALFNRANTYLALEDYDKAIADYSALASNQKASFNLGHVYLGIGNFSQAHSCFEKAAAMSGELQKSANEASKRVQTLLELSQGKTVEPSKDQQEDHFFTQWTFTIDSLTIDEETSFVSLDGYVGNTGNLGAYGFPNGADFRGETLVIVRILPRS